MSDFSRLSINSATTKKWTLAQVVEGCVNAGIPAIGPWRDRVEEAGLDKAARLIKDAGLRVSSLCRGGFLTAADAEGQAAALADNRAAILEAVALDTRELFLVVGGLAPGEKDVVAARQRVADRLADLVPFAEENGVRLVLEPLHPMYAADRALISTLGQAVSDPAACSHHVLLPRRQPADHQEQFPGVQRDGFEDGRPVISERCSLPLCVRCGEESAAAQ